MIERRLTTAIGIIIFARLCGAVSVVAVLGFLSRTLPPAEVGIVVTAQALALLMGSIGTLNMEALALRILPQRSARPGIEGIFFRASLRTAIVGLPICAALAIVFMVMTTASIRTEASHLLAIGVMIVTAASLRSTSQWSTGLGHPATAALWAMVLRPLVFILSMTVLLVAGQLTLTSVLWAAALSYLVSALVLSMRIRSHLHLRTDDQVDAPAHKWRTEGATLLLTLLFLDRFPDVVTLLAGTMLDQAEIASLAIALRLALIIRMAAMAFSMVLGPKVAAAMGENDTTTALRLTDLSTLMMTAGSFGLGVVLIAFAPQLMGLFNPTFASDAATLRILVLTALASSLFGPSLMVLVASDRTLSSITATIWGLAVLGAGTLIGARLGGLEGFAWGVVAGQIAWSSRMALAVRQKTGLSLLFPDAVLRQWQRIQSQRTKLT